MAQEGGGIGLCGLSSGFLDWTATHGGQGQELFAGPPFVAGALIGYGTSLFFCPAFLLDLLFFSPAVEGGTHSLCYASQGTHSFFFHQGCLLHWLANIQRFSLNFLLMTYLILLLRSILRINPG